MSKIHLFFKLLMFLIPLWLISFEVSSIHLDQRIETERAACDSFHDASLKADACLEYHRLVAVRQELPSAFVF